VQKLLGSINWLRPLLDISNSDLTPLFELLKGDINLSAPRCLTPEAKEALKKNCEAIQSRQAYCWAPELPLFLVILWDDVKSLGLIFQWDLSLKDPLLLL
ncbi:POK18 protein, partial [Tricholaema leucomelas]|nr:POK18 protein [Tricholaema leucomelas]